MTRKSYVWKRESNYRLSDDSSSFLWYAVRQLLWQWYTQACHSNKVTSNALQCVCVCALMCVSLRREREHEASKIESRRLESFGQPTLLIPEKAHSESPITPQVWLPAQQSCQGLRCESIIDLFFYLILPGCTDKRRGERGNKRRKRKGGEVDAWWETETRQKRECESTAATRAVTQIKGCSLDQLLMPSWFILCGIISKWSINTAAEVCMCVCSVTTQNGTWEGLSVSSTWGFFSPEVTQDLPAQNSNLCIIGIKYNSSLMVELQLHGNICTSMRASTQTYTLLICWRVCSCTLHCSLLESKSSENFSLV